MVITQEYLMQCLLYDPETGVFTWKVRPREHFNGNRDHGVWNARYAGKEAGHIYANGYITISVNGKAYKAHRLAFLYVTGRHPARMIDHINLKPGDNRFCNLREATRAQNAINQGGSQSSSGVKGVSWHKGRQAWQARLCGKYLGMYPDKEAAGAAYFAAAREKFGDFARAA